LTGVKRQPAAQPLERWDGPGWHRWDWLVGGLLAALATVIYLPYALRAGWFYDDWDMYAQFQDAGGSFGARLSECSDTMPAGRTFACGFHTAEYTIFGGHRSLYHVAAICFLALLAVAGYRVLRWCRLQPHWAGLAALLLVTFPASDATRLWPVAAIAQYVLLLQLLALLLALNGLAREVRWQQVALHVASIALSVFAMVTYEIAVPLVALNGLVYLAAYRSRRVLWRCGVDLALAVGFVAYRAVFAPPSKDSGFVVDRDLGGLLERMRVVLRGAWESWALVFAPSARVAALGLLALAVVVAGAAAVDRGMVRRLLPWLLLLTAAVIFTMAGALVFVTANDFYVPNVDGTFNRLNAPAGLAYCVAFVALLGLLYELVRRWSGRAWLALVPVLVVSLAVVWHQMGVSAAHKRAWERSWDVQENALGGYRAALRDVPAHANVLGFDTPAWEDGWVPVFSSSWDLRGAIDYATHVDPPVALPLAVGAECGPRDVTMGGQPFMSFQGGPPLYIVSPVRREAVRITSRQSCARQLELWGRPPLFDDGSLAQSNQR
jgi:hypothetical protein